MSGELNGKVALVTAGGSGLGRASSLELAARGASVMVTDLDVAAAAAVADEIVASGGVAVSCSCDIGEETQIAAPECGQVRIRAPRYPAQQRRTHNVAIDRG
ncbi:MAG: SDR family NAD(P)-dependent oxidoreductase [Novosphingobium sp.]